MFCFTGLTATRFYLLVYTESSLSLTLLASLCRIPQTTFPNQPAEKTNQLESSPWRRGEGVGCTQGRFIRLGVGVGVEVGTQQ